MAEYYLIKVLVIVFYKLRNSVSVVCVYICSCFCVCVYICVFCILMHVEVRGECWLSFSIACTLFFWDRVSHQVLIELTNRARLAGKQASGICLSSCPITGITDVLPCAASVWTLCMNTGLFLTDTHFTNWATTQDWELKLQKTTWFS